MMASIENAVARRDIVGLAGTSGCVSSLTVDVTAVIYAVGIRECEVTVK